MLFRNSKAARPRRRRRIRRLRLLSLLLVLGALGATSFTFGVVRSVSSEIPALDPERLQDRELDGYIYARDGRSVLALLRGSQSRLLVGWDDIAPAMKHAIVAVEDRRFWDHQGVDVRGIFRALWADIQAKEVVQGGSTITQQYVKNVYFKGQQSLGRKVKEAALAWQLTQRWSKRTILTAYLNTIYFGNGAYGIERAADAYFHHGADELTLAESALLAGIPKDPSRFDPVANPRAARARRATVLRTMLEQGLITEKAYRAARKAPLPDPKNVRLPGKEGPAHYFVNYVKQQLVDRYGSARVFGGGLRVTTSIDLKLQRIARASIAKWLANPEGPSAALVAIDPRNGQVLAMVGGRNFRESQFNLAVQGERQPGSSFKPFVLAEALEQGISPETSFPSKPVSIFIGDRLWNVTNYENAYLGYADLGTATIHSDNAIYAQLTRLVTPARVAARAKKIGVTSPLQSHFAIGLGAEAVNPLEMARAFGTFAKGGVRVDGSVIGARPRAILRIGWPDGEVDRNRVVGRRAVSPRTAAIVTSLLERAVHQGTGRRAALADGRPVAGKTGTTENFGDAWFVGYTPQLVTAVWVGYPNELRPMLTEYQRDPVAGGTFPALIWKTFMERAIAYRKDEARSFAPPPSEYSVPLRVAVRSGELQVDNGYCRGATTVWFFFNSRPPRRATCKPNEVDVPRLVGSTVQEARERLAAQPLRPNLVVRWADAGERVGIVLRQSPARGTLSSYDEVTLVVAKPLYGIVPKVIGLPLSRARRRLERIELDPRVVRFTDGSPGRVVFQAPKGGVAAEPGMRIKLVVAR